MPHTLTDANAFDSPISVPSDGDPANAASVEGPFQQFADRTRYLYEKNGPEAQKRDVPLAPISSGAGTGGVGWESAIQGSNIPSLYSVLNAGRCLIPLPCVVGDELTFVDVSLNPGVARATVGNRITLTVKIRTCDWSTDGTPTDSFLCTAHDDGTTNQQIVTCTFSPAYTVQQGDQLLLEIQGGSDAGTNVDAINGIRLRCNSRDRR